MIILNKPLEPNLSKLNRYLERVNQSGWYTNFGPLHEELTQRLEEYLKVSNMLLVSNGTLAIQVASKALNVNSAITTPFSFVATTSSLLWQGINTAFCDIDEKSFNLSTIQLSQALNTGRHYDAIVATHVYGNPCDVASIDRIANKYGKKVIYDAAHAFGVNVGDKSVLDFGDASTLSFHATKVFHTIEGGAIVFKKEEDLLRAKQLINFGIHNDGVIGEVGINAKLNEYQSAVGLCLLDDINNVIEHRQAMFTLYRELLKDSVDMPLWHDCANYNGAYMPILPNDIKTRDKIITALKNNGIQFRNYFSPSLDKTYGDCYNFGSSKSNSISERILCLPLHTYITKQEVIKVASQIKEVL
ncbi:DegT/DnrJ/EryC1/StrS family aminotransferase [Vibrio parahaemolyticus]|nr:DegT/DnrJ/EryC1/StrS family aminotransferase [Vibrio parahaemolyticus]